MKFNTCLPISMKSIKELSQSDLELCTDVSVVKLENMWNKFMKHIGDCTRPCNIVEYQGTTKKFLGWGNFSHGAIMINLFFPTKEMKIQEEYLIYGIVDLIGIVGGNLGLFIGFSFFDVIKCVFDIFLK